MSKLEREVISVVHQMKRGFDPKIKCSVKRTILLRNKNVDKKELEEALNRNF